MRKIILFIFGFLVTFHLFAQAKIKLENVIKPGTRLRYLVTLNDSVSYNFIIIVKQLVPFVQFDWEMDKGKPTAGTIIQTVKAGQSAIFLHNYFKAGDEKLDDKTVCVWLSKKLFNHFFTTKGKIMEVGMYGAGKPLVPMATQNLFSVSSILYNGSVVTFDEVSVARMEKKGNQWVRSGYEYFHFYKSAKMPFITGMQTDFFISLEEITTN